MRVDVTCCPFPRGFIPVGGGGSLHLLVGRLAHWHAHWCLQSNWYFNTEYLNSLGGGGRFDRGEGRIAPMLYGLSALLLVPTSGKNHHSTMRRKERDTVVGFCLAVQTWTDCILSRKTAHNPKVRPKMSAEMKTAPVPLCRWCCEIVVSSGARNKVEVSGVSVSTVSPEREVGLLLSAPGFQSLSLQTWPCVETVS